MPIYEYQCDSCQHEMEAIQRMRDAPLTECPECGRPTLRRKISAAGFRLKGGGWYETDFKSANQRNLAGDKKPGDKKAGESKSAGASESKTKTKPTSSTTAA